MQKFKIFYSWQSDLPGNQTRYFIRGCIDEAIEMAEESEAIDAERDEATTGMTGSPNIVTTLFSKIDDCDLIIADISLCFAEVLRGEKKSPNPNVMLELGYAVKTLGWERVICICNTDYGTEYPFDIAHNRITNYSLNNKTRKEAANELAIIIFKNIRDIKKLTPRAKTGMATHVLGAYSFAEHTVTTCLTPIDINNQESYILHNQELVYDAQQLVAEIQAIPINDNASIIPADSVSPGNSQTSTSLQSLIEQINGSESPVLWKEDDLDKATIKYWLGIDVPDSFFNLGSLKRTMSAFDILKPSYKGTEAERRKYNKLRDLEHILTQLQIRTDYLKTFDGMFFIPLAIQNISSVQDDNIRVVAHVNTGEVVEPDKYLIWDEFDGLQGHLCRNDDDDKDVGILCELFMLPEDGIIHKEEIPNNPQRHQAQIPIFTEHGPALPAKDEEDYALELQEFIATTDNKGYYEFNVESLRPGECKWLCCGMLLKPVDSTVMITYQIHSSHSAGDLNGSLEWHVS